MRAIKILAIVLLPFFAYAVYWQYQYERSKSDASGYCASMEIGSDISNAGARAEAMGVPPFRHGFRGSEKNLYAVRFTGPIFNAFVCELTVAEGKIQSKRVTALDD